MKNKLLEIDTPNPLILPIFDILSVTTDTVSEYELIERLQKQLAEISELSHSYQLALFQTHFLVMNALYHLQNSLWTEGYYLSISPLAIQLQPITGHSTTSLTTENTDKKLADYYLQWSNFEQTNEQDVTSLLIGFWQYYLADDKQDQAYRALGLPLRSSWALVQKTYRLLAAEKHPDRGGNTTEFLVIREAYEILRRLHMKVDSSHSNSDSKKEGTRVS